MVTHSPVVGDIGYPFTFPIGNSRGTTNLSSVILKITRPDGTTKTVTATVLDTLNVGYNSVAPDLTVGGMYYFQPFATYNDGALLKGPAYPSYVYNEGENHSDAHVPSLALSAGTDATTYANLVAYINNNFQSTTEMIDDRITTLVPDIVTSDIYNAVPVLNANHLVNWKNKRSGMDDGNILAKIGVWGDSISAGFYASNPMTTTAVKTKSFAGRISEYYKAKYTDVGWGYQGSSQINGTGTSYSYWTISGNYLNYKAGPSMICGVVQSLGEYMEATVNGTGFDLILVKDMWGDTNVELKVDGVINQHINNDIAAYPCVMQKITVTGLSDADHVVRVTNGTNVAYTQVAGIRPIKGQRGVQVFDFSWSGQKSGDILVGIPSNNIYPPAQMLHDTLTVFDFDVAIFAWLTNDWGNDVPLATYKANLISWITEAKADNIEVVLLPTGANGSSWTTTNGLGLTESDYCDAMREVAVEQGVCFIDIFNRYKNNPTKINAMLEDGTHPKASGHNDIFRAILAVLEG